MFTLQNVRWPGVIKGALYETGLLAFLAGLGLFLWTRSWSATAMAGLAVVGLAIVGDLALRAASWSRLGRWATPTQGDGGRALSPPPRACPVPTAVKCRPPRWRHAPPAWWAQCPAPITLSRRWPTAHPAP